MSVNWNNLINQIQNGNTAFQNSVGIIDSKSPMNFYDHPVSEFDGVTKEYYQDNANKFVFGFDKWGSRTSVVGK